VLAQILCLSFNDLIRNAERVQRELIDDPSVRGTFVVEYRGLPVATASAQLLPEQFPGSGCLHWVAVAPRHQGHKLGFVVSLATLHAFVDLRCHDALLFTDDHRLAVCAEL
jgi:mycothiol synthase